jgi:hypothetical protein
VRLRIFLDVTPCILVGKYQCLYEICHLIFGCTLEFITKQSHYTSIPLNVSPLIVSHEKGPLEWQRGIRRGIAGSNSAGGYVSLSVSRMCFVFSGRGLCVGLTARPGDSY